MSIILFTRFFLLLLGSEEEEEVNMSRMAVNGLALIIFP